MVLIDDGDKVLELHRSPIEHGVLLGIERLDQVGIYIWLCVLHLTDRHYIEHRRLLAIQAILH